MEVVNECESDQNTELELDVGRKNLSQILLKSKIVKSQKLVETAQSLIAKGKPWKDTEFALEYESLYNYNLDHEADGAPFRQCTWKRASEIFKAPRVFPKGGLNSENIGCIKQGALNNSQFLAALSAMTAS